MSIKAQLNSNYITVFIISIYVTHVKLYGLDDEGFNFLAGVRNFSHPKNVQKGYRFIRPPIGAPSPGVMWLEQKAAHSHHLLQRLRMSGPTVLLSHMPMLQKAGVCHLSFIVCMHSLNKRIKRSQDWELVIYSMKY